MTRTGSSRMFRLLALALAAAGVLAIPACNKKQAQAAKAEQTKTQQADAAATARQRFPEFLEAFAKTTEHGSFKVKAAIPAGKGTVDAWVQVSSVVGTNVAGPLMEAPAGSEHKKGDRVTVQPENIRDWAYTLDGKTVGNFAPPPEPAAKK